MSKKEGRASWENRPRFTDVHLAGYRINCRKKRQHFNREGNFLKRKRIRFQFVGLRRVEVTEEITMLKPAVNDLHESEILGCGIRNEDA